MKKTTIRFLIANGVLLLLALACFFAGRARGGTLYSQTAAERWAGEGGEVGFAQLSVFMSRDDSVGLDDIYSFRRKLTDKLTESSVEVPEDGAFVDAWSALGKLDVAGEHGSGEAEVAAVGGDFFFFHPLRLLSGSYIAEDDVMDDRVVLDRELAWRLFGGIDLAGMTVTIGGNPYVVAGVVEREQDSATKKAREDSLGMYMSYRAYSALKGDGGAAVDCYELVMPQPVKGFAEDVVKTNFKLGSGELVNNTGRYATGSVYEIIKNFGTRSMHRNSVVYPYWENAARYVGDWCALFLALALLFAVLPAVTALVGGMFLLIRAKDYLAKKVPALVSELVDRHRRRKAEERRKKAGEGPAAS